MTLPLTSEWSGWKPQIGNLFCTKLDVSEDSGSRCVQLVGAADGIRVARLKAAILECP